MTTEESPVEVAEAWEDWCGDTRWSRGLRALEGKATVRWWCGYPRSASAIPLTFTITANDGRTFRGSRLRDIQEAVNYTR